MHSLFLRPFSFGSGVRLVWSYRDHVGTVIAPDLATARRSVAAALSKLQGVPEAIVEVPTGRLHMMMDGHHA